jgi:hypothetical protein
MSAPTQRGIVLGLDDRLFPGRAIVPIVRVDAKTIENKELLGTGFFIDEHGTLMSVKHVLAVQASDGEKIMVHLPPRGAGPGYTTPVEITNVRTSGTHDLAVADVPRAEGFQALRIADVDPEGSPEFFVWDYSTGIRQGWLPDGSQGTRLIPYGWHGRWLTTYVDLQPGMTSPTRIIDVPFPVMKGASGAPLIDKETKTVAGIMFGNVARQLVPPPQMTDEGQPWYLPVGQAIHCSHIREFLEGLARARSAEGST